MKKFQQQRISRQGRSEPAPANCFSTYLMRRRLSTFCNLATYRKKVRRKNQEAGKIVASKVQNQQLQLQKNNCEFG